MLNISDNSISDNIKLEDFESYSLLKKSRVKRLSLWLVILLAFIFIGCLFLPWTQNISTKGYVITRAPQERPQTIQTVIAGRIENWFVQEGDFVEKGDTIVFISEVKSEYFDPNLIDRTSEQIAAKTESVNAYDRKMNALDNQYKALEEALDLKRQQTLNKIKQAYNKISMDSIDLKAIRINLEIAENQYKRTNELYEKGLKSLTDLQDKDNKVQAASAKVNVQVNKIENKRNELSNLKLELESIQRDYFDKMAKSNSERQSAMSSKMQSVADASKLKNQLSNYEQRQKLYYITAPQSGYITKVLKKGLGETLKEGAEILTIMPKDYQLAVEVYVRPQDIPLLKVGKTTQLRFDGWPAIVISGWPESSTGVFQGEIMVIDKFINENGFYRIIISPINGAKEWPAQLSIGTGVNAFILMNQVPIWYEIWRQLNGFPPDFYQNDLQNKSNIKLKPPIKSVK